MDWIDEAQDVDQWRALNEPPDSTKRLKMY
jgi:hypothetical protein